MNTDRPAPAPDPAEVGSFADLLGRVRRGDGAAAAELVRRYEPAVRLEVRMRLGSGRLRRLLDSMDICQSVWGSFFARAAAGEYDLAAPAQLVKLLLAIARNKVAYQARKERAQCRDNRRVEAVDPADVAVAAADQRPSQVVAGAELVEEFRRRLSAEERRLTDLRAQGRGWAEIAAELGGTAAARRMQWARTVERVLRELGLE
jgi:RNA polymerase sigma-70 factor (ECF subfamily)